MGPEHWKSELARIALAAAALSLAGLSCGRRTADIRTGRDTVHGSFCVQCHGDDLNGTTTGPPLQNLARHWTEESLAEYLRDPSAAIEKNPRLQRLHDRYQTLMPTFDMDEETRRGIARYLLDRPNE